MTLSDTTNYCSSRPHHFPQKYKSAETFWSSLVYIIYQILGDTAQNVVTQVTLCLEYMLPLIKLHLQLNRLSLSSLQMEHTFNKSISLNKICHVLYMIIYVTTSKLYFIGKFNSSSQNALYWEAAWQESDTVPCQLEPWDWWTCSSETERWSIVCKKGSISCGIHYIVTHHTTCFKGLFCAEQQMLIRHLKLVLVIICVYAVMHTCVSFGNFFILLSSCVWH
jgi:hypothetical protein